MVARVIEDPLSKRNLQMSKVYSTLVGIDEL